MVPVAVTVGGSDNGSRRVFLMYFPVLNGGTKEPKESFF